jgi:hypothetical protein
MAADQETGQARFRTEHRHRSAFAGAASAGPAASVSIQPRWYGGADKQKGENKRQ